MRTAFHEAGHAIVRRFFGLPVESVVIHENHEGKTEPGTYDDDELGMSRSELRIAEVSSIIAGYVCEKEALGTCEPGHEKWFAIGLMTNSRPEPGEMSLSPEDATAEVEELEHRVRNLLTANWGLVKEFAAELERRKLLQNGPLESLLSQVKHEVSF
jgi:hypothetical protein